MVAIPTKVNGNTVSATEFNQLPDELENVVTAGSGTPAAGTLDQVAKAVVDISANADYYTDGGAADAYVLSVIAPNKAPQFFRVGMIVRFRAGNINTGASTINPAGLGVKNIKRQDGTKDPFAGEIRTDRDTILRYNGTSFLLTTENNYPAFKASLTGDQTPTTTVLTKITIDNEVFDIGGYYDAVTNYRFTPLVAGKYFITAVINNVSDAAMSAIELHIYKNGGSDTKSSSESSVAGQTSLTISSLIELNGSTDYIELYGKITSGGTIYFDNVFSDFSAFKLIE